MNALIQGVESAKWGANWPTRRAILRRSKIIITGVIDGLPNDYGRHAISDVSSDILTKDNWTS